MPSPLRRNVSGESRRPHACVGSHSCLPSGRRTQHLPSTEIVERDGFALDRQGEFGAGSRVPTQGDVQPSPPPGVTAAAWAWKPRRVPISTVVEGNQSDSRAAQGVGDRSARGCTSQGGTAGPSVSYGEAGMPRAGRCGSAPPTPVTRIDGGQGHGLEASSGLQSRPWPRPSVVGGPGLAGASEGHDDPPSRNSGRTAAAAPEREGGHAGDAHSPSPPAGSRAHTGIGGKDTEWRTRRPCHTAVAAPREPLRRTGSVTSTSITSGGSATGAAGGELMDRPKDVGSTSAPLLATWPPRPRSTTPTEPR